MALSDHPRVAQWTYTRPTPLSAAYARGVLDKNIAPQRAAVAELQSAAPVAHLPFTVIRDEKGRYIGDVALYPVPDSPERRELSYTLHPDVHGRGIGGKAARAVLGFAVAHMGITSFQAVSENRNHSLTLVHTTYQCGVWRHSQKARLRGHRDARIPVAREQGRRMARGVDLGLRHGTPA